MYKVDFGQGIHERHDKREAMRNLRDGLNKVFGLLHFYVDDHLFCPQLVE
jgi:hypothetical protein